MFDCKQIEPPVQFKPEGIGEPIIGVRILVLPDPLNPIRLPKQNRIGTKILCRLLQARLELAGVMATGISYGLELNQAFCIFTVSELGPAQEAMKAELEELGLLPSAQIAWFDPREQAWRVLYSQSGRFDSPSDEEFAAERGFFAEIIAAIEKLQQSKDELSGQ
jgi:hypothetical protein